LEKKRENALEMEKETHKKAEEIQKGEQRVREHGVIRLSYRAPVRL
jgi:hypothetical protein